MTSDEASNAAECSGELWFLRGRAHRAIDLDEAVTESWVPEEVDEGCRCMWEALKLGVTLVLGVGLFLFVLVGFWVLVMDMGIWDPCVVFLWCCVAVASVPAIIYFLGIFIKPRHRFIINDVSFGLTRTSIRVRMGSMYRDLLFSDVEKVAVFPVGSHSEIGHIVFYEKGNPNTSPAIPVAKSRKLNASVIFEPFTVYAKKPPPHEQLYKGALTFWLVAYPERVGERILYAMSGINPNARGAYR